MIKWCGTGEAVVMFAEYGHEFFGSYRPCPKAVYVESKRTGREVSEDFEVNTGLR